MEYTKIKHELQNILSGKSSSSHDALIQTITNYLRSGKRASPMAQEKHENKQKEAEKLINFAIKNNLLFDNIDETKFISSGAEQKVYIKNSQYVIKLNDCIYYASWEDYFYNLLLHNYFFADTSYKLLGFYLKDKILFAVVQQVFVRADSLTKLSSVKEFLINNNFVNNRNHDYYHPELGIILEDLHDENVLTNRDVLYFIDTVFYLNQNVFWSNDN